MGLRVPTSTTYTRLERGLAVSLTRVQQLQGQLSSGSRISKMSDDPVGASAGLRLRAEEADYAAYSRTADDAKGALGFTDGALQDGVTTMQQVNALAISAVNGAVDPTARSAIADQIAALRDHLVSVANTPYLGRAVFGGHRATAVSVDSSTSPPTYGFSGDDGKVSRQVSPSVTLDVNLDGNAVFGFDKGAGQDVFSVLSQLEQSVRTGDTAGVSSAQDTLKTRGQALTSALGKVGGLSNRVDSAVSLGTSATDELTSQRSQIEDVDMAATIVRLQAAENGYQAALGAVSRANLPSLATFLQ